MKNKNKTHSPIFEEYWLAKGYTLSEAKMQVNNVKFGDRTDGFIRSSKIELRCLNELKEYLNFDI
jgi:hypothetical protein